MGARRGRPRTVVLCIEIDLGRPKTSGAAQALLRPNPAPAWSGSQLRAPRDVARRPQAGRGHVPIPFVRYAVGAPRARPPTGARHGTAADVPRACRGEQGEQGGPWARQRSRPKLRPNILFLYGQRRAAILAWIQARGRVRLATCERATSCGKNRFRRAQCLRDGVQHPPRRSQSSVARHFHVRRKKSEKNHFRGTRRDSTTK